MALFRKVSGAVKRVRQDPGTENTSKLQGLVEQISQARAELASLTDSELFAEAKGLAGTNSLGSDTELVTAMAVICETYNRTIGLDPFEVQVLAALNMLRGTVVNMATGEGKTLVGHIVACGLVLKGHRTHVLSANHYLAQRDANWGQPFFSAFGITNAAVTDLMSDSDRRAGYQTDITYSTVHQIGFDLLRDRQRTSESQRLIPAQAAVVVDEIDAVLLDDAMVPLVLAGDAGAVDNFGDVATTDEAGLIVSDQELASFIHKLELNVDYEVDPDNRSTSFLDPGFSKLETLFAVDDIFTPQNADKLGDAYTALHAHALLERDVHYLVADGKIKIINENRGRVEELQRWPDGLQSAVELKEALVSTANSMILDQVLVQTVIKGYTSVTGMSGTAVEAAAQLLEDFGVRAGAISTNQECIRVDEPDQLYVSSKERDTAAALRVQREAESGRPLLVGTSSVQASEHFAHLLTELGLVPTVLNAKNDEEEAAIISQAGKFGSITISTQMAGRGVDIMLDDQARAAGGLLVLSLGRYDSRRLDHQLSGRSGRQGDPGASVFFTSMEDTVVTENLDTDIHEAQIGDAGLIIDPELLGIYEHAQRRAEGKTQQLHRKTRDFNIVVDNNRAAILQRRQELLDSDAALVDYLAKRGLDSGARDWTATEHLTNARLVVLFEFDQAWADHLEYLSHIREGIHLRALGRENPLDEFNKLAGSDFQQLPQQISQAVVEKLNQAAELTSFDIESLGLKRPSVTWTYMVAADPFGSPEDNITQFIANKIRGDEPRIRYH